METVVESLLVPPAPYVHPRDLPTWRLLFSTLGNTVGNWSESAFEIPIGRRAMLGIKSVLVNEPAGVNHVLSANMANYRRPVASVRLVRPVAGAGLLLAEGPEWRRQRRMLAPAFTPASIELLLSHFEDAADGLMRRLSGQTRANLSAEFQDTALDAVLRALFSLSLDSNGGEVAGMIREYLSTAGRPTLFDSLARSEHDFPFAGGARRRFQKRWFAAVDAIVAARRTASPRTGHRDLLDLLIAARDPATGEPLTDEEIRDQAATMLPTGFETTSRMLFWSCYLLALDPAEQMRLRAEIAAFPPERVRTLADLRHWPRMRQVELEALRLYPLVPILMRQAREADEIAGEAIDAGTLVCISPWVLHRHKRLWEYPRAFMPDRFAGKSAPWSSEPAFIPFGAGPRICIGASFSLAEASLVMARLLQGYAISLDDDRDVLPVGGVAISASVEPWFRLDRLN